MTFLIVGLGNPGKEYQKTRHNAGFMVLDEFQKEHGFPDFSPSKKRPSLVSEGILNSRLNGRQAIKVLLVKPQTFMNNSGRVVKSLYTRYKIQDTRYIVVIHDDIDIPLGKVKISKGSGSAGHKGVNSIIQSLGTKDFTRIRIGIQSEKGKPENVEDFVLQKFSKQDLELLQAAMQQTTASLESLIKDRESVKTAGSNARTADGGRERNPSAQSLPCNCCIQKSCAEEEE